MWCYIKVDNVVLQAVGNLNKCMGFLISMNCVVSLGQMRVIVVVAADGAVINIQMFGAICEGILASEAFLTCNEHLVELLAAFLAYKAVIQVGGFVSG